MRVIFLALLAAAALAHERKHHECVHDTPRIQEELRKTMVKAPHIKYRRDFHPQQSYSQIRIVTSTLDLDDTTKYCTAAGDTSPDFSGSTVTCTADDVLTAEKKSILLNNVLPAAITRLEEVLKVQAVAGNLVVPTSACPRHSVPTAHTTSGVANADFVLYVSAGPTAGQTLAWAGACSNDDNGRPVVGRANFGPAYISWSDTTPRSNKDQVDTAIHEFLHALGFSQAFFDSMTQSMTLRGKTATVFNTPRLQEKYREFFGCDTLIGPEIEDEGGSGSAGSHFDRRVLKDELMAASAGNLLSVFVLAFMEDLGHYEVNYAAADNYTFGAGAGCGFVTSKCNTEAGGAGTWWCFEEDSAYTACTLDMKAVGFCSIDTLTSSVASYFQYFPDDPFKCGPQFADCCPWIVAYDNRQCDDSSLVPAENDRTLGYYYGDGGRCWVTTGVIAAGYSSSRTGTNRCFQSQCVAGRPQFRINGSDWITCQAEGAIISDLPGYRGSVVCPNPGTFCGTGVPVFESTVAPPATPAPQQDSSPTILGNLTFSGANWQAILEDLSMTIAMQNIMREEMAAVLTMLLEDVQMLEVSATATTLDVHFGLVTFRWTPGQVEDEFNAIIASGGTQGFERTVEYYSSRSSDTTALTAAATQANRGFCTDPMAANEDFCLIVIGGIIVALILLCCMCYCCYRCCCKSDDLEDEEGEHPTPHVVAVVPRKPAPKKIHANPGALPVSHATEKPPAWGPPKQPRGNAPLGKAGNPLNVGPHAGAQVKHARASGGKKAGKQPQKENFW